MNEKLESILKDVSGQVVGIGIDNKKLVDTISKNKKVTNLFLLENNSSKNRFSFIKGKVITIKGLDKEFHKKRTDYLISHYEDIKPYLRHFIKNSIYITNKYIYIYGKYNKEQINSIINKYKRYNVEINIDKYNSYFILKIVSSKAVNNYFKDKFYLFIDYISDLLLILEEVLVK